MISYQPLWDELNRRGMARQELKAQGVVNNSTLYRLINDEPVSMTVLMQICDALDVPIERIVVFNKL